MSAAQAELRCEVTPPWPFQLPRAGTDGVARRRGDVLERLLHVAGRPVVVQVTQPRRERVVLTARVTSAVSGGDSASGGNTELGGDPARGGDPAGDGEAASREEAALATAIDRMRFALGVDDDLRPFWEAFRDDRLIGRSLRARPHLRVARRPDPFEALAWAICEQLIEYTRAVAIERRIVQRLGRRCGHSGLRDLPDAARLAGTAPALLQSFDLSAGRALALIRAAREVASGRADLLAADHERAWRRLRAIPGIGQWTIDVLALHGQGRMDMVPAGDLAYLKWAGRLLTGRPGVRATETAVRELLEPYGPWAGLAGAHALRAGVGGGALRASPLAVMASSRPRRPPRPAGTRW